MSLAMNAHAAKVDWKQQFEKLSNKYLDRVYLRYQPTAGTQAGYHQYDTQLEDYSRKNVDAEIADSKRILEQLEGIRAKKEAEESDGSEPCSGEPGSNCVQFRVAIPREGEFRVLAVLVQDPLLSQDQVEQLKVRVAHFGCTSAPPDMHCCGPGFNDSFCRSHPDIAGKELTINSYLRGLYDPVAADLEIVESNIRARLLTLETIRPWEKNADNYSSACANGAFVLMERKFASPDERLRSLIAREKQMPALLEAARANLKNPPRIYTEIAIEQLPGIVSFFQQDVPSAFADAQDAALKAEFTQTNAAVIAALKSYLDWLKTDLLPRSNGDFRIGAETFLKKLQYDEMVALPLDKLLEIGWADLRRNQEHFKEVAKELEPGKTPGAVLEELGENHPAPDHLLDAFRATFDGLVGFIRAHHIVTIPSDARPIVEETPPFMRATTLASMDTPGPFETHATEAYFNVTLPDPSMKPDEVEGYMHSFNVGTVISTAVHEAYPGHYIQFLWLPKAPSRVRKLLGANTDIEGWAHYCEQMMLDEGYGQPGAGAKNERESKFLRLGQLQDALLRNARFIVGIQMHSGKMSFEEAQAFFQKEGYQSKETAVVETKRGTSDPTYLYYTLGKLEIMKLREDMKKKQGAAFSLEEFHDNLLRQGFPPIKIVREALLGDNSTAL
jgi:uncharacterized protein (DUF885 family)